MTYERKTDLEIANLALGIFQNRIFTSLQVAPEDQSLIKTIFMPLAFLDAESAKRMHDENVSLIYANMSDAGPRSLNGYPCFMEANWLNREDAGRVLDRYKAICAAVQGVSEETPT